MTNCPTSATKITTLTVDSIMTHESWSTKLC